MLVCQNKGIKILQTLLTFQPNSLIHSIIALYPHIFTTMISNSNNNSMLASAGAIGPTSGPSPSNIAPSPAMPHFSTGHPAELCVNSGMVYLPSNSASFNLTTSLAVANQSHGPQFPVTPMSSTNGMSFDPSLATGQYPIGPVQAFSHFAQYPMSTQGYPIDQSAVSQPGQLMPTLVFDPAAADPASMGMINPAMPASAPVSNGSVYNGNTFVYGYLDPNGNFVATGAVNGNANFAGEENLAMTGNFNGDNTFNSNLSLAGAGDVGAAVVQQFDGIQGVPAVAQLALQNAVNDADSTPVIQFNPQQQQMQQIQFQQMQMQQQMQQKMQQEMQQQGQAWSDSEDSTDAQLTETPPASPPARTVTVRRKDHRSADETLMAPQIRIRRANSRVKNMFSARRSRKGAEDRMNANIAAAADGRVQNAFLTQELLFLSAQLANLHGLDLDPELLFGMCSLEGRI